MRFGICSVLTLKSNNNLLEESVFLTTWITLIPYVSRNLFVLSEYFSQFTRCSSPVKLMNVERGG